MRNVPLHTGSTAPGLGDPIEPNTSTVGFQFAVDGDGAVTASVQMVGRVIPGAPLENIGSAIAISGTATPSVPVVSSVTLTALGAAQVYASLLGVSAISFRAYAAEGDA